MAWQQPRYWQQAARRSKARAVSGRRDCLGVVVAEEEILLVTAAKLQARTSRELAQLARSEGVRGWHSMRKAELVEALLESASDGKTSRKDPAQTRPTRRTPRSTAAVSRSSRATASSSSESKIAKRIRAERQRQENLKDLSLSAGDNEQATVIHKDRVVLIVRDAWWLQAYWEVTRSSVKRARVALAQHWHTAQPALRLLEVSSDGNTNSVEQIVQDLPVSGEARNWFLQVPDIEKTYRIAIGYAFADGQFHLLAKSNEVRPPSPQAIGVEDNWADISADAQSYFALSGGYDPTVQSGELQSVFEQRTRHPLVARSLDHVSNHGLLGTLLEFEVDAQMVVFGTAQSNASVTVAGEPVRLQSDGSFALRMNLPERRQVLPVVVTSCDGLQQKTTVLAVERNTKELELVQLSPEALG